MTDYFEVPETKDFKTIGNILRKKREEHSFTLEHVAEITRITLTSLRNIEAGNKKELPALVFVRGFVRNYANLLGLESDWMVEILNRVYEQPSDAQMENKPASAQPREPSPNKPEGEEGFNLNQALQSKNFLAIGGLGAAMLVLIILLVFGGGGSVEEAEVIHAIENPTEQQSQTGQAENQPIPTPAVISPLNLTLLAKENDWLHLIIDDKKALQIRMEKGKKYVWPGNEGYKLTMSTGASAQIYLNGEEVEIPKDKKEMLFDLNLNKFSLTQMNNR